MAIKGLLHHLPDVVHPLETVCYQITIPKDPWYIRAFVGTFFELASARSWDNDEAHTALDVAKVWLEIALALKPGCDTSRDLGGVEENEQMLRIKPDNPCIIQQFCDPDWQDWFDASKCVAAAAAQETGGSQPEPGQEACYNAVLQGSGKYLLPAQVSAGDIISVTDTGGGWSDGSGLWNCPDGSNYIATICVPGTCAYDGGDPLPTACHASLIMKIAGVYYAVTAAPFVVPSGVSMENVEFQMNDPSLSDNFGSIHFKACLTAQDVVVHLTPITGSGGSIPSILNKSSVRVGERFTCAPQLNASNGYYDGGFTSDAACTWRITGVSNYGAVMSPCDWQWYLGACHTGAPAVPTDSPASTSGWVGNSNTADSLEFELISIP